MRPVFKLPGRAAVIMVTSFLGNFSAGHIAVNNQYKSGRMTQRESVCISTSLATVSVGTWSLRLRFMLAVLPVTSIIFLASFVPCCMGTDVPVKFSHLGIICLERMILSILIAGFLLLFCFLPEQQPELVKQLA